MNTNLIVEQKMNRNCEIVMASIEVVFNRSEYNRIPDFYTPDFFCHPTGLAVYPWDPGHHGLKEHIEAIKEAFPDYHEEPELVFGDADLVVVRQKLTGTNTGKARFGGQAGKKFSVTDMMICKLKDGRLHEQWGLTDRYSQFIQLGIIESPM